MKKVTGLDVKTPLKKGFPLIMHDDDYQVMTGCPKKDAPRLNREYRAEFDWGKSAIKDAPFQSSNKKILKACGRLMEILAARQPPATRKSRVQS